MKNYNLLVLFLFVILTIIHKTNAGFTVTVEGKKLVYTGFKTNYFIDSIVLSDKSSPTVKIIFSCTKVGADGCICKSTDLDFTKLIGSNVVFNGKQLDGKNKNPYPVVGVPLPTPSDLKFTPSTSSGLSAVTGKFLRFGYGEIKTIKATMSNGKTTIFNLDPPVPKDATKFTVNNPGGSGSFSIQLGSTVFKLNYTAPSISQISYNNKGELSIVGSDFGNEKQLVKVYIGSDEIDSSSIISVDHKLVVAKYEPKQTQAPTIKVLVNGLISSNQQVFKFPPVPISFNSLPKSGGLLTITGKCFKGITDDKVATVIVGSYSCPIVLERSTQIVCTLGAVTEVGGSKNLKVVVSIDGISSNNDLQYSFGVPSITSVIQNEDNIFTINGMNLGSKDTSKITIIDQNKEETSPVPIEDNDLEQLLSFTLGSKVFTATVTVTHDGEVSNEFKFYTNPVLLKQTKLPLTEGGLLEISGLFLDPKIQSTVEIENSEGEKSETIQCKDIAYSDEGSGLACNVSPGSGNKLVAVVSFGTQSFKIPFSYQAPSDLVAVQKDNNVLEVVGKNLGQSASLAEIVLNEKRLIASSLSSDNTVLTFNLPNDMTSDPNAILTVDGISSNQENGFKVTLLPICKSISSTDSQGGLIFIDGCFFDPKSMIKVNINDKPCNSIKINNATTLECYAPPGYGQNNAVTITVNDVQLTTLGNINFSYNPPNITKVELSKGGVVTIIGKNLPSSSSSSLNSITIDSKECKNITIIDSIKMECTLNTMSKELPSGNSTNTKPVPVVVSLNNQTFTIPSGFEYSKPEPTTKPINETKPTPSVSPKTTNSTSSNQTETETSTSTTYGENNANILISQIQPLKIIFFSFLILIILN